MTKLSNSGPRVKQLGDPDLVRRALHTGLTNHFKVLSIHPGVTLHYAATVGGRYFAYALSSADPATRFLALRAAAECELGGHPLLDIGEILAIWADLDAVRRGQADAA